MSIIEAQGSICGVAPGLDIPHLAVEQGFVLDLDRTVTDVHESVDLLSNLAALHGLTNRVKERGKQWIEESGGFYDPVQYILEALGDQNLDEVGSLFIRR